ncbi:Aste57867_14492 [Aphanomyces stellatus]|uniref:Aste57867_14492 protein n=1 Tax=Aphanomyces stellatus TaxID=120398 RepID=A0A485L1M1_9STRA|nr:hypothetical protein As57867_014438 [Aphanomyces stellatus]VFT91314.1 Aste57867_14492 [Aphanomyces stellatus]
MTETASAETGFFPSFGEFYNVSFAVVVTLLVVVSVLNGLYAWVASRQVRRPKKRTASFEETSGPTTPLGRHMRRRLSFNEVELENEVKKQSQEEADELNEVDANEEWAKKQDWTDAQMAMFHVLRQKYFSSADNNFMGEIIGNVESLTFAKGAPIFARGKYDGSLFFVSSGRVSLSTFHENKAFTHTVQQYEGITSSACILRGVLGVDREQAAALDLEAVALDEATVVLKIGVDGLKKAIEKYPQYALFLANISLSQLERITMRSLIDYFGMTENIYHPQQHFTPLENDTDTLKAISTSLGLEFDELHSQFAQAAKIRVLNDKDLLETPSPDDDEGVTNVYFVLQGAVSVDIMLCQNNADEELSSLYQTTVGCCVGMASAIVGSSDLMKARSVVQARAVGKTRVVQLNGAVFRSLLKHSSFLTRCVKTVIRQYGPLVALLDNFFEWVHVDSGDSIYHAGDPADSMFTVLTGRLREVQEQISSTGNVMKTTRELVKGTTLGALDMLAVSKRASTVYAVRDCQMSKMPRFVLEYMLRAYPHALVHFTREMAIHSTNRGATELVTPLAARSSVKLPVTTIAVLPATKDINVHEFTVALHKALLTIATTEVVSSKKAEKYTGRQWRSLGMSAWLAEVESVHQLVVYEADTSLTPWSKLCIRQADHILLLCKDTAKELELKDLDPLLLRAYMIKNVEINIVRMKSNQTDAATAMPSLDQKEYINYFHNIRVPLQDYSADTLRIARRLTGRSIGLVLGGGGARGLAHIGILKAIEECGLDVDVVGGTSMGAFIAALYAQHPKDLKRVIEQSRRFSGTMANPLQKLMELTLPIASFFDGSGFNRSLQAEFQETRIEDLVLNFFCISTDIIKRCTGVHRSGMLWRYIRASMSLQGYLPPISEPNGSLLLDGGYVNNLPADVMKEEGVKIVFAVDVGRDSTRDYFHYGDSLSGWWLLLNKLNPFTPTVQVPSMGEVSDALAYAAFYQNKDHLINNFVDLFFKPPVQEIGTLEFDKLEQAVEIGYEYAMPKIKEWLKKHPHLVGPLRKVRAKST